MHTFQGKRTIESYNGRINHSPDAVFPLLCPVREYDWLDGWACNMIYSDSGVVENNCIFTSEFVSGIEATWVTVRRDEENHILQFVLFFPGLAIARMDISLEKADNGSALHWVRTMTGLSEDGNRLLDHFTGEPFRQRMDRLIQSLNHYLGTGKMLK